MNASDIIKQVAGLRRFSYPVLAEKAGYKSASNITGILNRGDSIKVNTLVTLLDAMGCELIVVDKMGTKAQWVVTNDEAQVREKPGRKVK